MVSLRSAVVCLLAVAFVAVAAPVDSAVFTPCFTVQCTEANSALPVVMGMTRVRVNAVDSDSVFNEAFFDGNGSGDAFSDYVNHDTGSIDCFNQPDVRVVWGTNYHDATGFECSNISHSVTFFRKWDANQWIGCGWTTAVPTIYNRSMNTCPNNADLWHEAMSMYAVRDENPASECNVHANQFDHFRAQSFVSTTNAGAQPLEDSCMTVIARTYGTCGGDGPSCL